ncbi:MAG: NADAR family protein [Sideroxydans sp.]|nr:NADAR family protein [Sideroxydans sp.]
MTEPLYFYTKTMPYWGLSNFSPPGVEIAGKFWPTVEHYFQAQKFLAPEIQERIRQASTPKEARALGQSRTFPLRADWEQTKESVMLEALRCKFKSGAARELLLSTGNRQLIESSPFDYFWAAGQDGTGKNRLGFLLMQVRSEIMTFSSQTD